MADNIPLINWSDISPLNEVPAARHQIRRRPLPPGAQLGAFRPSTAGPVSNSYQPLPADEDSTARAPKLTRPAHIQRDDGQEYREVGSRSWTPYALRLPFLVMFLLLTACLLAVLIAMHHHSIKHTGFDLNNSTPMTFGWRFAPTLVAVVYVFISMVLSENVNRTESVARLATPQGSTAPGSMLRSPGPWWTALADSFPRWRNNHQGSVVLFSTTLMHIFGFLVLSPLSGTLLAPQDITINNDTSFTQLEISERTSLQAVMDNFVYYRTIGNMLQNVTTSPWVADNYTVIPFSPSIFNGSLSASPFQSQTWHTKAAVFQTDLTCEKMDLLAGPTPFNFSTRTTYNYGTSGQDSHGIVYTFRASTASGCELGFAIETKDVGSLRRSSSFWCETGDRDTLLRMLGLTSYFFDQGGTKTIAYSNPAILLNSTDACQSKHFLTSFQYSSSKQGYSGLLCSPSLSWANIDVQITNITNRAYLSFDDSQFHKSKKPVSDNMINMTTFMDSFLNDNWAGHLMQAQLVVAVNEFTADFQGPMPAIGSLYDFDVGLMISTANLTALANRLLQRAFAEAFQTKIPTISTRQTSSGQAILAQRRLVIFQPAAYICETILGLQVFLILLVIWRGRQNNRSLGLSQDIAFTNTTTAMIGLPAATLTQLRLLLRSDKALPKKSHKPVYKLCRQKLTVNPAQGEEETRASERLLTHEDSSALPFFLSNRYMVILGTFLAMLLVAIAILYWYSKSHGLYQAAWIFQKDIKIGSSTLGNFAPFTIVPTILAVCVGLWWDAIESFFRRTQPYITMAAKPTPSAQGSGVSYQSSYWLWSAMRAIHRKHWLLATLSAGAFTTQILTIAMSALWQIEPSSLPTNVQAYQPFQLREIPHVFSNISTYKYAHVKTVLDQLFTDLRSNWMYSAVIQLTLNGSEPAWSKDGWSFVPLDIPGFSQLNGSVPISGKGNLGSFRSTNITLQTKAIRATIDCVPWPDPWWLKEVNDIHNTTLYNVTADPSRYKTGWRADYQYKIIPGIDFPLCCPQGTMDKPGLMAHGFWVPSSKLAYWDSNRNNQAWNNFTIKWIEGPAQLFTPKNDYGRLTWLEKPSVTAANCTPTVEWAEAKVVVDAATGNVQTFDILNDPVPHDVAWTDNYVQWLDPRRKNPGDAASALYNITSSYGNLFMAALTRASQLRTINGHGPAWPNPEGEDTGDNTFNFRQPGLNLDFMTYSMLSLAKGNYSTMRDVDLLIGLAQTTFQTFFQHYVSSNVTVDGDGSWVYQRVNATLPDGFPTTAYYPGNVSYAPHSSTDQMATYASVTIDRPIQILHMSPLAVCLSTIILFFLLVTTVLVLVVKKRYFSPLLHPIDTPADVAMLVIDSEQYLTLARQRGMDHLQKAKDFSTRLGWFRTSSGQVTWGIELIHPEVDWLTDEEVRNLNKTRLAG